MCQDNGEDSNGEENPGPIFPRAAGDGALLSVFAVQDAAPDEEPVDGHDEVVDADGAVGVVVGGEIDDNIEDTHQQAQRPKPSVGPIFAYDIEQTDGCADDVQCAHLEAIDYAAHEVAAGLLEPVVVVVVGLGGGVVGAIDVGTETVVVVEDVVDGQLTLNFVVVTQAEGVGGAGVEEEVGGDFHLVAACVVGILLTDVFADELQLGVVDGAVGCHEAADDGGRECEVGGAEVKDGLGVPIVEGCLVLVVDDFVEAQGEIAVEGKLFAEAVAADEFNAEAVAFVDVVHQRVAALGGFAVGDQLVFVEHGVEVALEVEVLLLELVAEFEVEHGLVVHVRAVGQRFLDVGACSLAVADACHEVGALVVVDAVVDTHLGIEEEVRGVVVELTVIVVGAVEAVADVAHLKVGIEVEAGRELVVEFCESGGVVLATGVGVPVVEGVVAIDMVLSADGVAVGPYHLAVVVAVVELVAAAKGE